MHDFKKFVSVFLINLGFALKCYSAQGCYITNGVPEPRIYYQQYPGSQNSPVQFFTGTDFINVNCPNGATSSTSHPGNITPVSPSTNCWAEWNGKGTNRNNPGNYNLNGYLVNYNSVQCPIDDYVPVLLFGVAGLGIVVLKRKFTVYFG